MLNTPFPLRTDLKNLENAENPFYNVKSDFHIIPFLIQIPSELSGGKLKNGCLSRRRRTFDDRPRDTKDKIWSFQNVSGVRFTTLFTAILGCAAAISEVGNCSLTLPQHPSTWNSVDTARTMMSGRVDFDPVLGRTRLAVLRQCFGVGSFSALIQNTYYFTW